MKITSFKIKLFFVFLSISVFALSGCGDQALFDELATNRVKVIIKGTYESNGPREWNWINTAPEYATKHYPQDDSIYVYPNATEDLSNATDYYPNLFMLDIAGIKVANADGHNQYFANYRKTYSDSTVTTAPSSVASLFNGEGVEYENEDMRPNFTWSYVQVYIRKMLFDSAKQYVPITVSTWGPDTPPDVQDMFAEKTVNGFNFNLAQVLSYYDSLKMNYGEINRIFPLSIPVEDGFIFNNKEPETVLEIRFVIKNFVKKYEYEYNDVNGYRKLRHFYAVSDWLRNILKDEPAPTTDTMGKMGSNLLAVARYYVPGKTATITGSTGTGDCYVIAIKSNNANNYSLNSIPNHTRPIVTYDEPKKPRLPILLPNNPPIDMTYTNYLEGLLQYYLQYEVYKQQYDAFADLIQNNYSSYESQWNNYETAVSSLKIPQLATWAPGGNYTITNVPKGVYYIYYGNASAGELPASFAPAPVSSVTITEADYD